MASRTSNVIARVEPEVKREAEEIMDELGVPTSVVINMLYKQIIRTRSIPFPIALGSVPMRREDMDSATFNAVIQRGLNDVAAGLERPADEVFSSLRAEIANV